MRRRDFIKGIVGSAAAWPLAARAQQTGKIVRIGILGPSLDTASTAAGYQAFLDELRALGFRDGQNLIVEYRRVDDSHGPFAAAAELMRMPIDLVIADGPEVALQAVVGASRSIPVVIRAINYDPIERGYVAGLARPGGNITGVFSRQLELAQKQLELLTQAFPERKRVAVLWDALSADQFNAAEQVAQSLHLNILSQKLEKPPYDFAAAFLAMTQQKAQMVLVLSSPFFSEYRSLLAELEIKHHLPAMFIFKAYVEAGGLLSYGADSIAMYRRVAGYVAKILNGTAAADLPIEQATKFELAVNLKTAKAIGVEIPTAILLRADEVIE